MPDIKGLVTAIKTLQKRVDILVAGQQAIVEHLGESSQDFRAKFIATILSNDEFRHGFTEHINNDNTVSDAVRTQMIAINETVLQHNAELEEE